MVSNATVAAYVIKKLKEAGCHKVFGIPGTSCAAFFKAIERAGDINYILTSNELEAGYMADGYGRHGGIGAVCVSYGVGTLSLANAIAGALTERVPMIVINGGPRESDVQNELNYGVLFSHSTGRLNTDYEVMKHLCVSSRRLSSRDNYQQVIDELFCAAIEQQGPVYLEVAQDKWEQEIQVDEFAKPPIAASNPKNLSDFLKRLTQRLEESSRPVVLVGTEIESLGLKDTLRAWLKKHNIPFATTLLSKANIFPETDPLFGGVYDSDLAPKAVRELVEEADLVFAIGAVLGVDHLSMVKKQSSRLMSVAFGEGRIGSERLLHLNTKDVVEALDKALSFQITFSNEIFSKREFKSKRLLLDNGFSDRAFSFEKIFQILDAKLSSIEADFLLAVDTCLASYPAADIDMPENARYLANPVWLSIGHATPAAVGGYFARNSRPIIISGDGGFQMVAQSVSTMARYDVPAIVIVLDNGTYAIEQFLIDGSYFVKDGVDRLKYTVLNQWRYDKLSDVFGGQGYFVDTVESFEFALDQALTETCKPVIISARLSPKDLPAENMLYLRNRED